MLKEICEWNDFIIACKIITSWACLFRSGLDDMIFIQNFVFKVEFNSWA